MTAFGTKNVHSAMHSSFLIKKWSAFKMINCQRNNQKVKKSSEPSTYLSLVREKFTLASYLDSIKKSSKYEKNIYFFGLDK